MSGCLDNRERGRRKRRKQTEKGERGSGRSNRIPRGEEGEQRGRGKRMRTNRAGESSVIHNKFMKRRATGALMRIRTCVKINHTA